MCADQSNISELGLSIMFAVIAQCDPPVFRASFAFATSPQQKHISVSVFAPLGSVCASLDLALLKLRILLIA